jgi:hypothetical protein
VAIKKSAFLLCYELSVLPGFTLPSKTTPPAAKDFRFRFAKAKGFFYQGFTLFNSIKDHKYDRTFPLITCWIISRVF